MAGSIALITGASSGIGAAIVDRLAGRVDGMVIHARKSEQALAAVAARARKGGARVVEVLGDLAESGVAKRLVERAISEFGRLDFLVANAGFPIVKSLKDGSAEDMEYAFRGNVFSFFELARSAEDVLASSSCGRIVAIGSFTAHVFRTDIYQFPLSASSKGAVETAVRSLALAFAQTGTTVNCVVPGYIRKDAGTGDGVSDEELEKSRRLIPLQRLGTPEDIAATVDFLLSQEASYITGQSIHVNGGLS